MNTNQGGPSGRNLLHRIRSWALLLPLVGSMMWAGAAPTHAAGENWAVKSIEAVGCQSGDWQLIVEYSGTDGTDNYVSHVRVTSGWFTYMDQAAPGPEGETAEWSLYGTSSYGPTTGVYPIPAGQPMKAVFTLERPKGTVLSSWTMVAASCDSPTLLYNGPTAADLDGDYVATPTDRCPALRAATATGCPARERALTLRAKQRTHKLLGTLVAPGFPALHTGQPVEIWKKKPGPDRRVRTVSTDGAGTFKVRVRPGRYYATAPAVIVPTSGEATADVSGVRRIR